MTHEKIVLRDSFLNKNKTLCRSFSAAAGRANVAAILKIYRYGYGYRVHIVTRGRVWWCRHPAGHRVTIIRDDCKLVAGFLPHV